MDTLKSTELLRWESNVRTWTKKVTISAKGLETTNLKINEIMMATYPKNVYSNVRKFWTYNIIIFVCILNL